jgi:2-oxo-4-hydroxy-4-carboxy-5-ureidoimidazoline decarboxylase
MDDEISLPDFADLPATAAAAVIAPCCASVEWQRQVVDRRPFGTLDELLGLADSALSSLSWVDVLQALAAHPRIGERAEGAGLEARWSRAEQSADVDDQELAEELATANEAYWNRFGFPFLICATGMTRPQMLAELVARVGHEESQERWVVRAELAKIVRLRLAKTFIAPGTVTA